MTRVEVAEAEMIEVVMELIRGRIKGGRRWCSGLWRKPIRSRSTRGLTGDSSMGSRRIRDGAGRRHNREGGEAILHAQGGNGSAVRECSSRRTIKRLPDVTPGLRLEGRLGEEDRAVEPSAVVVCQ